MARVAGGSLAAAISRGGGLGMIGVGSQATPQFVEDEAQVAREGGPFGIGLMVWALPEHRDLLDAAIAARPRLLSLSFGDPTPYVALCHDAGILVATQVQSQAGALKAEAAGVDLIVAQGAESGGHAGFVATLPLLATVLDAVRTPVAVAGGIASAAGLAAVLAAGAVGAWIGTAFLAAPESRHSQAARERILAAQETDTIQTHLYDRLQHQAWPEAHPGRALRNPFNEEWAPRVDELVSNRDAYDLYQANRGNYDVDYIYAGQAVGLVTEELSATEIVRRLGEGAEAQLRRTLAALMGAGDGNHRARPCFS